MSDPVINLYAFQGLDGIEAEEHEALGHLIVRHGCATVTGRRSDGARPA